MSKLCGHDGKFLRFTSALLLAIFSCTAFAETEEVRYALELHRLGAGIRPSGLGNAFVAADAEAVHMYWNGANLANAKKKEIYCSHTGLFGNIASHDLIMLALPMPSGVGLGGGYIRYQDTDIPKFGVPSSTTLERFEDLSLRLDGNPSGTFSTVQDEIVVALGKAYSVDFPRMAFYALPVPVSLAAGASFKFYRSQIDEFYGLNANMDIGMHVQIGLQVDPKTRALERWFAFGANLQDILQTPVTWRYSSDYQESTQPNYKVGFAYAEQTPWVHGRLLFLADVDHQYERTNHVGLEYAWLERVALRCGYEDDHPSVGAGISYRNFRIDYSYTFHPLSAIPLQIGLRFAF